jgi:PPOX class probable F420-dependent enzyme
MIHPIASAKYVSFVSYRRDGSPVATPVWIAPLGNDFGFTIDNASGKAKRLAHTNRATIQQCDVKGKVAEGTPVYRCTAKVVLHSEAEIVRDAIAKKYGLTYKAFSMYLWFTDRFGKKKHQPETAVIVSLVA